MKMLKVKVLRGVLYKQEILNVGDELDLPEGTALSFVSNNQVEIVKASSTVEEVEASPLKSETEAKEVSKPVKKKRATKKKK